jgi:hypothetical protein
VTERACIIREATRNSRRFTTGNFSEKNCDNVLLGARPRIWWGRRVTVRYEAFTATECIEVLDEPTFRRLSLLPSSGLVIEAETVSETLDHNSILTWLIAHG